MGRSRSSGSGTLSDRADVRDRDERRVLLASLIASLVLHLALVMANPRVPMPGPPAELVPRSLQVLPPPEQRPPTVETPPRAVPIPPPSRPVLARSEQPSEGPESPRYIPHDVPPSLLNGTFVSEYLEVFYPPGLRLAGIEGRVLLWLYVERDGEVTKLRLQRSSGVSGLDDLAKSAARLMSFRPALTGDRTVAVWVSQPLEFRLARPDSAPSP